MRWLTLPLPALLHSQALARGDEAAYAALRDECDATSAAALRAATTLQAARKLEADEREAAQAAVAVVAGELDTLMRHVALMRQGICARSHAQQGLVLYSSTSAQYSIRRSICAPRRNRSSSCYPISGTCSKDCSQCRA